MKKLTQATKSYLLLGAKMTGSFSEGFFYVEENLPAGVAPSLLQFCEWIDSKIGGASAYNIDMLYSAFKNPKNVEVNEQANALAARIADIRRLVS